jgi:hypothetical protein
VRHGDSFQPVGLVRVGLSSIELGMSGGGVNGKRLTRLT